MSALSKIQTTVRLASAFGCALGAGLRLAPSTYVDIGARGGLPRPWHLAHELGLIQPVFFEPDAIAANKLRASYPKATVAPWALGSTDGKEETLYVTKAPGQSSVVIPDKSNPFVNSSWDVIAEEQITVRRLDAVWEQKWGHPSFVKIDVQGYELQVIQGIGNLLPRVLCLEVECTFIPFYKRQPVFQEVYERLRAEAFDLVKLRPIGLYNGVVVVEFNAFFVRSDSHSDPRVQLWKAVNDVAGAARIYAYGY
jgi:FkbM family methyltransferase